MNGSVHIFNWRCHSVTKLHSLLTRRLLMRTPFVEIDQLKACALWQAAVVSLMVLSELPPILFFLNGFFLSVFVLSFVFWVLCFEFRV